MSGKAQAAAQHVANLADAVDVPGVLLRFVEVHEEEVRDAFSGESGEEHSHAALRLFASPAPLPAPLRRPRAAH